MITLKQLNQVRKNKKITLKDVSRELKISQTQAHNLLAGKSEITLEKLCKIADLIEVDIVIAYKSD